MYALNRVGYEQAWEVRCEPADETKRRRRRRSVWQRQERRRQTDAVFVCYSDGGEAEADFAFPSGTEADHEQGTNDFVRSHKPSLYWLFSFISLSKRIQAGVKKLNFPLTEQVYNYSSLVDVGLNSGPAPASKPKPRDVHLMKKPQPKLSDYYRPNFDNAQRIRMDPVKTAPELTVQYDGMAVSRLLDEIDNLIFM